MIEEALRVAEATEVGFNVGVKADAFITFGYNISSNRKQII